MRIGILTYAMGINYGAQAQLYALSKFLKDEGHEITILKFYPEKYWLKNLKIALRIDDNWFCHPLQIIGSLRRMIVIKKWINKIPNSITIKNGSDVDNLKLDKLIIGSDEVINCIHPFFDEIYLGKGIVNTSKVYYAPSAGALSENFVLNDELKDCLCSFEALSVRDEVSKNFIKNNTNSIVKQVLDPTFLWDFNDMVTQMVKCEEFILLYSFDSFEKYRDEIVKYANKSSLKIVSLGRYYKWADINYSCANMREWITCFKKSKIVMTDSFHGLAFSIENMKDFILVSREDKVNKNSGLLNFLNINKTYYGGGNIGEYVQKNLLDYDEINPVIQRRVSESKEYLRKAILR